MVDAEGAVFVANREALDRIAEQERPVADALERADSVDDVTGTDPRIARL